MKRTKSPFKTDMASLAKDLVFRVSSMHPEGLLCVAGWILCHVKMTAPQKKSFLKALGLKIVWQDGIPVARPCEDAAAVAGHEPLRELNCPKCGKPLFPLPTQRDIANAELTKAFDLFSDVLNPTEVRP